MHSGAQADPYGHRDLRADDINRPDDDEGSEAIEDLEDDDFIDHDVEDADAPIDPGAERLSRSLLFIIPELGVFKTNAEGREVYVPGKGCLGAVKDIIKFCRHDNPKDPLVKHYLGKWETLRKDLVPLFVAQKQNKKVIYYVLTLIAYLTTPLEIDCANYAEHKTFLESYKELLSYSDFADDLVQILGETEQIANKTKAHENLIEVIVTIIRNILLIECRSTSTLDAYKDNLQKKLYQNFTKSGGVFDAITYLCQNMQGPVQKRLRLVYLEIFYSVLASFPASFIVDTGIDKEYFKSLRERERLNQLKRRSELSSRHSRFGAMFQVKRTIGSTSAITSTLNFDKDGLNKLDTQRVKPKPNARHATNRDTQIFASQAFGQARGILNEEDRNLQLLLKRFIIDFLEHSYGPLIDSVHDCLQKDLVAGNPQDFLHFFVVAAFGIEVYNLEFELSTNDRPQESTFSRPQVEDSMTCKFAYVIHGVQVTLIEMLYKSFIGEIAKKRSEFNTKLFHACLYYLNQILTSTHILSRSTAIHDQRNAKVLKEVIFSKEFAKILKIGFDYFEPKLHGVAYVENLMTVQDAFFNLLAQHAKDRILSAKTDKIVKKAQKRQKKRALETAKAAAAELPANEDGTPADHHEPEDEDSEEDDPEEDYVFKERKYNYYSEFSSFVDYPTISKVLGLIRGDRLLWNSKKLNAAIQNYLHRIVNDLKGEWVFFQNDFLALLAEVVDNFQIAGNKEYTAFIHIIRNITKQFFNYLSKNPMLAVEAMFRFPDLITKDQILNNYEIVIPVSEDLQAGATELTKQTLPWTREEDLILVENYEYYKDDAEPWNALLKVLRDQAYFRNPKDIKFRIKLLKVDKSKDVALEIVHAHHSNRQSLEEVVVRMLLYTLVKGRDLEHKALGLLKNFVKEFTQHKAAFANSPSTLPLLPILEEEFQVLELQFMPVMLEYVGLERPGVGRVWWRANPDTDVEQRVLQIEMEYERLKHKTEAELLDMGDKEQATRRKIGKKLKKTNGTDDLDLLMDEELLADGSERKPKRENTKKANKRETRRLQKAREREAIIKLNREIAGLGSDDEALEVAESESAEESDDESSHRLDYAISDEEKPAAKPKRLQKGGTKSRAMDIEEETVEVGVRSNGRIEAEGQPRSGKQSQKKSVSEESQEPVPKKRRLTKGGPAAPASDEES